MLESGMSVDEVAAETGRTSRTIRLWRLRHEEEGEPGMAQRPKSGRPRTTTAEQDAAMVQVIYEDLCPYLDSMTNYERASTRMVSEYLRNQELA